MNKYHFILFSLFLSLIFVFSQCSDDLGNYNYHDINKITIGGIDSTYVKLTSDSLTIRPVLTETQANANLNEYSYEWSSLNLSLGVTGGYYALVQILDSTKTLEKFPVNKLAPGTYRVFYKVKDKVTGVEAKTDFALTVKSVNYEGYLIMNDVDGKMRLDMLSYSNSDFVQLTDVLKTLGSKLPPQNNPLMIANYTDFNSPGSYAIYLLTGSGSNRIHGETFQYELNYNISYQMLGQLPSDFKADAISIGGNSSSGYLVENGNVHTYNRVMGVLWNLPGKANTFDGASYYKAAGRPVSFTAWGCVVFDSDSKSIYKIGSSDNKTTYLPTGNLFSFTNTGKDMLYMRGNNTLVKCGVVMKDVAANKSYYGSFATTGVQSVYAEIKGPDVDKAECFALANEVENYLFYSVGGKLYEFDASLGQSFLMLDLGANKKITFLNSQHFLRGSTAGSVYNTWRKNLTVGYYDESTKTGTLSLYKVALVNGPLELMNSWTGFGKIVDVAYRDR